MNKRTCEGCDGACCKYVAMEIDVPENLEDFENIRWYVAHKNVSVYVEEDGTWNIEFTTPCSYLVNGKCSIHEDIVKGKIRRPTICKEFSVDQCPFYNEYKEKYRFEKMEDVDEYIEKIFKKGLHFIREEEED
jgi:hypothetical protein